jgi:hypothetical protein
LPLEAYSLPGWYADLLPDYCIVEAKLGTPYAESNTARYDSLSTKEKNELAEYAGLLHQYFKDGLQSKGIEGDEEYYHSIVLNQQVSGEVHQSVRQKLAQNPRAMELMEYFNISL